MDVRGKTLVIVSGTIILLIVVLSVLSSVIVLNDYVQLEDQSARENMYRAESAITEQIATIDAVALDWAAWNDTYVFIEDRNDHYIDVNLVDGTLANLR